MFCGAATRMPFIPANSRAADRLIAVQLMRMEEENKSSSTFSLSGLMDRLEKMVKKLNGS